MKRLAVLFMASILCMGGLSACQKKEEPPENESTAQVTEAQETNERYKPVTIESMGESVTFHQPPKRIVALGYDLAEMLTMLGEKERMVSLAPSMYRLSDVKEEYQSELEKIKVLPDGLSPGVPTLETVLEEEPDFVLGYSYSFSNNSAGSAKDYLAQNINFYATEGTYIQNATIENTYNDFLNLGKILGKEKEAEQIVAQMREQEKKIQDKMKGKEAVPVYVFDGDPGRLGTIGGFGFQNNLIQLAGGKNIFDDLESDFPTVSIEDLIQRNPHAIIIVEYYKENAGQEVIDFLNNTPELQSVEAVKNKHYIVIPGYSFFPCAQNIDLVEQIAEALHP